MTKLTTSLIVVALTGLLTLPAQAQPARGPVPRASAHDIVSQTFDPPARDTRVVIVYGRPGVKGRKIFGDLVKYNEPWRLGADEATTLLTQQNLELGGTAVPAGAYTLYMIPSETGTSKLAISKKVGAWGIPVDQTADLARVDLKKDALETPVEVLTIALERNPSGGGILKISWENSQFTVPFTIKK